MFENNFYYTGQKDVKKFRSQENLLHNFRIKKILIWKITGL